ncbi:MAG: nucleotidyltransferase domain-containing protein [Anaerolineales bacterium]|nr:nucleotidyltransferase domain-containing protein [Anaerolineales bacterium]
MPTKEIAGIDLIVETIRRETSPERIILFGSQSHGNTGPDSDVDIAIIQKKATRLGQKAKVFLALAKSGYDWQPEVDLHIFSEQQFDERLKGGDLFAREVKKGKILYQAEE